jgi:hypothetical protein
MHTARRHLVGVDRWAVIPCGKLSERHSRHSRDGGRGIQLLPSTINLATTRDSVGPDKGRCFPDLYSRMHRDEQNGISPNRWFRSQP